MSITTKELTDFSKTVGNAMFKGDQSFLQCLTVAAHQQQNKRFQNVLKRVIEDVNKGYPLSVAMRQYPTFFSEEYVNKVRNGEVTATLGKVLRQVDFREEDQHLP